MVTDLRGRGLEDLRISVTDRCNFRCGYCMPREVFGPGYAFLPRSEVLTYEEIERFTRVAVSLGVRSIRLTGGEPLLRRDLERLVAMLAAIPGVDDLALTTNGALLADKASTLKAAGLDRVTVSLDSLDPETFARMNDVELPVERVLHAIEAASAAGLHPIKINCVVRRGMNDDQVADLAGHFKGTGHIVRFIEYMDVGGAPWERENVVPASEIVARISERFALEPIGRERPSQPATGYRYRDGTGEIGVIASVTQPFCGDCTRARISADGKLFTCLFASGGHDLRSVLRGGASDEELRDAVAAVWRGREDRYSEQRGAPVMLGEPVPMSYLGG
jgi:cyclic pyranopterin phosphate synthase